MDTGQWLKVARQSAGLSQRELGARAGVSAMAISKYERGLDMPSSGVVVRLAEALGVAPAFFFGRREFRLDRIAFRRRHPALTARAARQVTAQLQDWLNRYADAEALTGQGSGFSCPPGFPFLVASLAAAELAAEAVRAAWDLGMGPIANLLETIEGHGIKVGLVDGPDGFDAVAFEADGVPVIAVRAGVPGDRQRFSVAHELGHIVMAPVAGVSAEKAANRFAAALLVPAAAARVELGPRPRHDLDAVELQLLKRKYGLSMRAWYLRALELGLITAATARRLRDRFERLGWDRVEPGEHMPPEVPRRLEILVRHALAEETITTSRAAELLGLTLAELRARDTAELAASD